MRKALGEYEWLGHHLDSAFCMWQLARMSDDGDAIELYQRAIPIFQDCRFTFAMAECRLDLGLKYMLMKRYDEALLHLEISRPQLQENKTGWLANFCLAAIIVCLRQDKQAAQADIEMKNNRAALLETACMETRSPWKLSIFPAEGETDSEDGQILFMLFDVDLCHRCLVFVDSPPSKWNAGKVWKGENSKL
ncbi:hypothetical protein BDZ94DRAFT_1259126 [Collybia nuda]|uniref:Tetratricopeptide repeat protein n=1 Tax=Collybia nuda TaxID=64659 RepID=A0A9P5Y6U2_9AGAR|nr:hypothetical protein BDZ94DRAFT_1259126 [Collybia nuda]